MSDEPTPFTFKAAPTRKVTSQKVEDMGTEAAGEPAKRKRRTRAEMQATSPFTPAGELAVLKACLKQLRSLDDQARARTLVLLKAVFE